MYARMRLWLLITGLLAGACYAQDRVDLDRPGALEQLQRENARHFAKIERILREAPKQSASAIAGWMRANFDAKEAQSSPMLKTSYPAQTRISFVLDDTRYSKVIYIDAPARPQPAR
jgi:hypothetical protein